MAFEQLFKINIIVSPAKAIRYPTKDIASKKHSQHVDGVIYCPVKIHTFSKDNMFDFKPEASLLTNKPIVFYKSAFHHRSIIDEILFRALLSTQLSLKEKLSLFSSIFLLNTTLATHLSRQSTCHRGKQASNSAELLPKNPHRTFPRVLLHIIAIASSLTIAKFLFHFAIVLIIMWRTCTYCNYTTHVIRLHADCESPGRKKALSALLCVNRGVG